MGRDNGRDNGSLRLTAVIVTVRSCTLEEHVIGKAPRSCHVLSGTGAAILALPLAFLGSLVCPVLGYLLRSHTHRQKGAEGRGIVIPLQPLSPSLETLLHPGGLVAGPGARGRTRFPPGHTWAPRLTTLLGPCFCFAWLHDLDASGSFPQPRSRSFGKTPLLSLPPPLLDGLISSAPTI